jgi:hypothetical protein
MSAAPRTWVAASCSVLLAALHTAVSLNPYDDFSQSHRLLDQWKQVEGEEVTSLLCQVAANLVILVAVNLVGLFIHNLTEEGQRRAFLDTRDCIAARLEMEDENEKLVRAVGWLVMAVVPVRVVEEGGEPDVQERLLLSVLPQHVAVEMKADIMSPVEVRGRGGGPWGHALLQGQFHKIYIQRHENVR